MASDKRDGRKGPDERVRREPPDDPAETVERLLSRRQLIVEDGDVLVVREAAGIARRRTDLSDSATSSNSQYRLSVRGQQDDRRRVFAMYERAVMDGEALAAARHVRLFYVENAAMTLLKDYRPGSKV
jgi:hypothetical protein